MKNIVLILMMIIPLIGMTTDYYVNDNSLVGDVYTSSIGSNTNDGLTPSTPFSTLTMALSVISIGDVIYVDAGNYIRTDIKLLLNIDNISIIGAGSQLTIFDNQFNGTQEDFLEIRSDFVTISGISAKGYDFEPGNQGKAITVRGGDVLFSDVSLTDNQDNGDGALAIFSNSTVEYTNSVSSCNLTSGSYGGGILVQGNNIYFKIVKSDISNNGKSAYNGGGLLIEGGTNVVVDIEQCLFENNNAVEGGAIWVDNATINIKNSCFNNNVALREDGGGIFIGYNVTATIEESSFNGNRATGSYGDGGAISMGSQNSTLYINNCIFENNRSLDGNAIYVDRAYSSGSAQCLVEESYFSTSSPIQYSYEKSDAQLIIRTSGTRLQESGSSTISGNNLSQTLPSPDVNCIETTGPCGIILSVELKHFYGLNKGNINKLIWETYTETNNSHFILSRLNDNMEWVEIKRVIGNGDSKQNIMYEVYDMEFKTGDNYYKLTQVDYDGNFEEFDIIIVEGNHIERTLDKRYNTIGQEVDEYYKGVVIYRYTNGTFERILQ